MVIDGHMHLEYGELSVDYVLQFVEQAKKMGIDRIQILDHTHRFIEFEPCYENLRFENLQNEWLSDKKMKFKDSLDDYVKLAKTVQSMDLDVEVLFGLEVCYVPEYETMIRDILSNYHFDFLVGAVHSIDGLLYDMSFSKHLLWDKYDTDVIYKRYYELIVSLIESKIFTQLAHPDTIKMFNIYPSYDLTATYQMISSLTIRNHMKVENNTGCHYRYNHKDIGLSNEFLAILVENGNEIITASDAHTPLHVGKFIKEALINENSLKDNI